MATRVCASCVDPSIELHFQALEAAVQDASEVDVTDNSTWKWNALERSCMQLDFSDVTISSIDITDLVGEELESEFDRNKKPSITITSPVTGSNPSVIKHPAGHQAARTSRDLLPSPSSDRSFSSIDYWGQTFHRSSSSSYLESADSKPSVAAHSTHVSSRFTTIASSPNLMPEANSHHGCWNPSLEYRRCTRTLSSSSSSTTSHQHQAILSPTKGTLQSAKPSRSGDTKHPVQRSTWILGRRSFTPARAAGASESHNVGTCSSPHSQPSQPSSPQLFTRRRSTPDLANPILTPQQQHSLSATNTRERASSVALKCEEGASGMVSGVSIVVPQKRSHSTTNISSLHHTFPPATPRYTSPSPRAGSSMHGSGSAGHQHRAQDGRRKESATGKLFSVQVV